MNLLLLLNLGVEQSDVQATVFVTSLIYVDNLLRVFLIFSFPGLQLHFKTVVEETRVCL